MHHQRLAEKSVHLPRIDHVAPFHLSRLSLQLNTSACTTRAPGHSSLIKGDAEFQTGPFEEEVKPHIACALGPSGLL